MYVYMHYQGRAVEISDHIVKGREIPRLYPGDRGEKWGDFAEVEEEIVFWDGARWLPALSQRVPRGFARDRLGQTGAA